MSAANLGWLVLRGGLLVRPQGHWTSVCSRCNWRIAHDGWSTADLLGERTS